MRAAQCTKPKKRHTPSGYHKKVMQERMKKGRMEEYLRHMIAALFIRVYF